MFLRRRFLFAIAALAAASLAAQTNGAYFPGRFDWEKRAPQAVGMDGDRINEAISFARANESKMPRDLRKAHDLTFGREVYGEPLGPFQTRGELTGVIVRHGYIVAEWGEPMRPDMVFSTTKSFLSTVVGLAYDRGLIHDLNDRVKDYVPGGLFDSDHNAA